ncbi:MAG: MFS transporter, partial [Ilumatobacteraceae bacterium]
MTNTSVIPPPPDHGAATATARARVTALWSFTGKYRILHLTWMAFFLSFVVWFNYAPFANTIAEQLGLTEAEEKTIALCNVALTIPARIFIGMALDRWGPRRVYAAILMFAVIPNTIFA